MSIFTCNKIFISNDQPLSTIPNKFWFDLSNLRLKYYTGTAWVPIELNASNVDVTAGSSSIDLQTLLSSGELNTTSSTIIGAINELNDKIIDSIQPPITSSFTPDTTSLVSFIADSTKANIQGKVLISPNINNLGAVYVGKSVTDKTKAFPLYPNQIVSFSFTDITNFKCAVDVLGDSFNYVVEFGVLNSAVTPAEGLIIVGTDGSKYRLNPTGEAGSETFTLTKIS